jgi:hypothetical protein
MPLADEKSGGLESGIQSGRLYSVDSLITFDRDRVRGQTLQLLA